MHQSYRWLSMDQTERENQDLLQSIPSSPNAFAISFDSLADVSSLLFERKLQERTYHVGCRLRLARVGIKQAQEADLVTFVYELKRHFKSDKSAKRITPDVIRSFPLKRTHL